MSNTTKTNKKTANNANNETANVIETANVKTANNTNIETTDVVTLKQRNIVRVTRREKNRYYIEVDGEPFLGYNKDGEVIETNTFSIDLYTLAKQVGNKHEIFNTAFTMSSVERNKVLNPTIVALCFTNSTVDIVRTHKNADDLRETGIEGDTYGKDIWKTEIANITPNISNFAQQSLIQMIFNPATLALTTEPTAPTVAEVFANMK